MGRKKLPNELKAKNWTIKIYDWEKEIIKHFIKKIRSNEDVKNSR